ncbi:hypothetical protein PQI07_01235 [Methylobacterium sp. 092160098-2]|uniref:Protein of unassigned function n=1 Tax=Methylobacterium oryzae CBMB20 TaxID=693986 RepID=A0A089NJW9_9HYPH|nr:hypothetical protein [Methylobacterium sp. 092160098-2]AIQ88186.1 protein of unassigned function [Methylobacterium oryzae CBMB20]MDE4909325.1 hypothetical protein [Methylobacterium sp. 092160098-2]
MDDTDGTARRGINDDGSLTRRLRGNRAGDDAAEDASSQAAEYGARALRVGGRWSQTQCDDRTSRAGRQQETPSHQLTLYRPGSEVAAS